MSNLEMFDKEYIEDVKEVRQYVRRIGNDSYNVDTKDGYQLVQEDWIAGALEAILEYSKAIEKEMNKKYNDAGYISEKTRKIRNEVKSIAFRVDLMNRPLHPIQYE